MQMDYNSYKQQFQNNSKKENFNRAQIQFIGALLKNDGDMLVVRFPYTSPSDLKIEHCHEVTIKGYQYPQKVECIGKENNCPLCADEVKTLDRFLVKAIAYIVKDGNVELVPVVWDRPTAYADELIGKMEDYGDLSEHLFKIKRNGLGQQTKYSTDIIMNKTVYSPDIYIKDFSQLENIQEDKILIRRLNKYLETQNTEEQEEVSEPSPVVEPTVEAKPNIVRTTPMTAENPTTNRPRRYSY